MKGKLLYVGDSKSLHNYLIIRGAHEDDAKYLLEVYNPEITKNFWFFKNKAFTLENEKKYLKRMRRSSVDKLWLILLRRKLGSDKVIGTIGLHEIDNRLKTARLGIIIWNKIFQHRGYGIKAITAILTHAFTELNIEKIYITVLAKNYGNNKFYQRIGFVKEGILRKEYLLGKKRLNMIRMSLLKTDWVKQSYEVPLRKIEKGEGND